MLEKSVFPLLFGGITGALIVYLLEAWIIQDQVSNLPLILLVLMVSLVVLVALFMTRVWHDKLIESKVRTELPNLSHSHSSLMVYIQSLIAAYRSSHHELKQYRKIIAQHQHQEEVTDNLLSAVLGGLDSPVLILNNEAQIIEFNTEAERLFGYEKCYALGKTPQELPILGILNSIYEKGWNTEIIAHAPSLLKKPIKTLGLTRRGVKISCKTVIQQLDHNNERLFIVRVCSSVVNASKISFIDPKAS